MKKISIKDSRELYGKILEDPTNLEGIAEIPMCICRGGGVCSVTREKYKIKIEEIRYNI